MKRWIENHGYWMKIPMMLNLGMLFIVAGVTKLLYQSDGFTTAPWDKDWTSAAVSVWPAG